MDQTSQDYFNLLVGKLPEELTPEEVGFLRARRDYLDPVQKEIFGSVLGLTTGEKPLSKARVEAETPAEPEHTHEVIADENVTIETDGAIAIEPIKEEPKKRATRKKK